MSPACLRRLLASGATRLTVVDVPIKDAAGDLLESAIPKVVIVKDGTYDVDGYDIDLAREVDLVARIEHNLEHAPLAGFGLRGSRHTAS